MKVRRLEINGFKSFADRTVLDFPQALCAVVGPNGCGKSNVVDAIRWVLGEQSMKQLRGHERADVIFNGATERKPLGMAEVSLVFENDAANPNQRFADLAEIMITRRLYRSGESEFLINKMPCRLKDIQQLLMDTGLGNRAYAIIEQGKVASFIEARPEERRLWVEEAAGITRYKNQKKISLRKMTQAQENMDRLNDIMHEVETQMNKLERQAKKAQRYRDYRDQVRDLDLKVASFEYDRITGELNGNRSESDAVGASLLLANQRVTGLEADLETLKVRVVSAEQEIAQAGERQLHTQGQIQKAENELTLLSRETENTRRMAERYTREKDELELKLVGMERDLNGAQSFSNEAGGRLEHSREAVNQARAELQSALDRSRFLEADVDRAKQALVDHLSQANQAKNRLADLERAQADINRRRESLSERHYSIEQELNGLTRQRDEAKRELTSHRESLEDLRRRLSVCEEEQQSFRSRLRQAGQAEQEATRRRHELSAAVDALSMSLSSYEWAGAGVRDALNSLGEDQRAPEFLGVVADHIKVNPGWESQVEAALGAYLQALVAKSGEDVKALAELAQNAEMGRLSVVALNELKPTGLSAPRGSKDLREAVSCEAGFEPLASLLEGAGAGADLAGAWEIAGGLTPGQSVVDAKGRKLTRPGAARVGGGGGVNVLARRNELAKRKEELAAARSEQEEAATQRVELEANLAALEEEISVLRGREREEERQVSQREQAAYRLSDTEEMKKGELEMLDMDSEQINEEAARIGEERQGLDKSIADHLGQRRDLEEELARVQSGLGDAREGLEELRRRESEAMLEEANLATRAEHARQQAAGLGRDVKSARERIQTLSDEIENAEQSGREFARRREAEQQRLGVLYENLDEQQNAHKQARETYNQAQMKVADLESAVKQAHLEQRKIEGESQALTMNREKLDLQCESLCEQIMERCRIDLTSDYQAFLPEGNFDAEASREKLGKLRQRMSRLGPVNLEAISEHEALSERHGFLTSQKQDLETSLADLHQAIRKINRESRGRFRETLEEVNNRLADIYPVLFNGGKAELTLDPNVDPLDSGLHLMVELPGKHVRNLEALSGGEKAMAAAAVLFALFLIKPAPFCILDEVDAPLDEANVGRFHKLLHQLSDHSQIVLITHSRRTMEIMDMLYGVTMEEKGVSKLLSVSLEQGESMAA